MTAYNDDDRAREVVALRAKWVDGYVGRAINRAQGDCTSEQITEWENAAYRIWREHHPALNSLLPEAVRA